MTVLDIQQRGLAVHAVHEETTDIDGISLFIDLIKLIPVFGLYVIPVPAGRSLGRILLHGQDERIRISAVLTVHASAEDDRIRVVHNRPVGIDMAEIKDESSSVSKSCLFDSRNKSS